MTVNKQEVYGLGINISKLLCGILGGAKEMLAVRPLRKNGHVFRVPFFRT